MTRPRSGAVVRALALVGVGLLAGFALGFEWYRARPPAPPAPSGGIDLVGAGATFPYPLYRRWFAEYGAESGVRINYFSVGSGEGIRLLLDGGADFGASDRPLTADERARASCGPLELPMVLGAVTVAYNLPGLDAAAPLRFDADVLAGIFMGRIARWDDPAVRALNPGRVLPAIPLRVVHRVRTSGTGDVFAAYLATSREWRRAEADDAPRWRVGLSFEGNEGVAAELRVTPGTLGFMELSYADLARLPVAALRNASGAFVRPDSASIEAAAGELATLAGIDTLRALVHARAAGAYPVVAVTRIVADRVLGDEVKSAHLIAFVRWALDEGARSASGLGYRPLPQAVADLQRRRLDALERGTCPPQRVTP